MKRKLDRNSFELGALFMILFVCVFMIFSLCYYFLIYSNTSSEIQVDDYMECNNLSVKDTAYCLRDYIKPFFNYTKKSDRIHLSLDELKVVGGDCSDWSDLYKNMAIKLGMKSKKVDIFGEKPVGHRFALIWDNNMTGYCKLDMLNVNCFKFKEEKVE